MVQYRFFPGRWIGHIQFVPCHVKVATDDQGRLGCEIFLQEGPQPPQPVELVGVVRRADDLAVGNVGADDLDAADLGRDEPSLRVFCAVVHALPDVLRLDPAQDAYAIERRLAENRSVVARLSDRGVRKCGFLRLQFLEADDVRLGLLEPSQQPLQAGADGVDIPGGDLHGDVGITQWDENPIHFLCILNDSGRSSRFTSHGFCKSCLLFWFHPRLHFQFQARKKVVLGKCFWTPSMKRM